MKRALATAVAVLALPGSALAAGTHRGVVLTVDRAHHVVQLVDGRHVVHAYHYRGRLGRVHPGSHVVFSGSGSTITRVQSVTGASHTVSFYGRIVRSGAGGLIVRVGDGQRITFSSRQVRRAHASSPGQTRRHAVIAHMAASGSGFGSGTITVNIQGLQPGVTVLVTESVDGAGNITINITLPAPGATGSQQMSGVVTDVGQDAFMLQTADGSALRLHMASSSLAALNLNVCDTVDVSFHQDSNLLIADSVQSTGTSSSGDCGSGNGSGDRGAGGDVVGTITAVSGSGLTVSTQDQGSMTFIVDSADITDGFVVGDVVDVSYDTLSDGTLDAGDVEYVEQDSMGTVTAVSASSLTLTDSNGQSQTFTGDPSQGIFDGVSVGDQVDVTFHQSGGQQVADVVDDQSAGGSSGNGGGGASGGGD